MIRVKAAPAVKRSDIFILQVSFGFGTSSVTTVVGTGNQMVYAIIRRPLVLPTVIVGVVAMIAGQTKGEHFVISGSLDISVARSPIESAVHDRWPVEYRAAAGEIPEDRSGPRVQRVHLPGIGAGVHDAVCNTDRTS